MAVEQATVTPTDSCPDCAAVVSDLEAHKHWHSRLVADLATAVEHEIKRSSTPTG